MRQHNLALCALLLFAALAAPKPSSAQQDRWLHLGQSNLIQVSTEAFVPANSARPTVCSVRMQSVEPVEVQQVTVHFTNHQSQRIPVHMVLSGVGYSQSLNLPGTRRKVSGVSLVYTLPTPGATVPEVHLWGNELLGAKYCPR